MYFCVIKSTYISILQINFGAVTDITMRSARHTCKPFLANAITQSLSIIFFNERLREKEGERNREEKTFEKLLVTDQFVTFAAKPKQTMSSVQCVAGASAQFTENPRALERGQGLGVRGWGLGVGDGVGEGLRRVCPQGQCSMEQMKSNPRIVVASAERQRDNVVKHCDTASILQVRDISGFFKMKTNLSPPLILLHSPPPA